MFQNYRVKSPVYSFRDLEVYQKTIELSNIITTLNFVTEINEKNELKSISEQIPKLIAESYGDKFDSLDKAHQKLTDAITLTTNIITKIDLLRQQHTNNPENKDQLDKLLTNYQRQKLKILNLRKAWNKVFSKDSQKSNSYQNATRQSK